MYVIVCGPSGPFWAAYDTVLKSSTHEDGHGFGFIGFHALSQIFFAIGKLIPGATPWYFSSWYLDFGKGWMY